jgi:asparagine synthase (glutamine-hydrolysing)
MSGIVGIFQLDRSPIETLTLRRMTDFLAFRGPDAKNTWVNGPIGFGHTLLKTTDEAEKETQPLSLDGKIWIVADARVDARKELVATLRSKGQMCDVGAPAPELILRSYHLWGEDCVEHLHGDFSFGIWDGPLQKLFCARDHLGAKPFYYAHLGPTVIFSNTLDCIRQHPAVSDRLNDLAIADFLLFEIKREPAATSFADIQRLEPAHRASWSSTGHRANRYWTLPIEELLYFRRANDYVEGFKEVLEEAVRDRLRTQRVAISLSGGLDSSTLAATAQKLSGERSPSTEMQGFTKDDALIPEEREYVELVSKRLGIPVKYHLWGEESVNPDWERTSIYAVEPEYDPRDLSAHRAFWRDAADYSRVLLRGEGPDEALRFEWRPYMSEMLRGKRYIRLAKDVCRHIAVRRQPPFWNTIKRKVSEARSSEQEIERSIPPWINSELASRLDLRGRWEEFMDPSRTVHPIHPNRPSGYESVKMPARANMFEAQDTGNTLALLEMRSPFLDIRTLRFMLRVPPLPWCHSKYLMRRAMRDVLPEPLVRRPKSSVFCADIMEPLKRRGRVPMEPAPGIESYVDLKRFPETIDGNMWAMGDCLRARLLNHWLQYSLNSVHNQARGGAYNEAI